MRRDDAIDLIKNRHRGLTFCIPEDALTEIAKCDVDTYVALGMLKLDEPKSANDRAVEVFDAASSDPRCGPYQLLTRLEACGLKIVEK